MPKKSEFCQNCLVNVMAHLLNSPEPNCCMANCLGTGNGGSNLTDPSFKTPRGIVQTTASASNVTPDFNVTCTMVFTSFHTEDEALLEVFDDVSFRDRFVVLEVFVDVPPVVATLNCPLLERFDRRTRVAASPRIRFDWRNCGRATLTSNDNVLLFDATLLCFL